MVVPTWEGGDKRGQPKIGIEHLVKVKTTQTFGIASSRIDTKSLNIPGVLYLNYH
jgi:hypothetical protein